MKKNNLCLIALISGFFLFVHNPCRANATLTIVGDPIDSISTEPDDDVDPDWLIFVGHFKGSIDRKQ